MVTFESLIEVLKKEFPDWKIFAYKMKRGNKYIQMHHNKEVILINYGITDQNNKQ